MSQATNPQTQGTTQATHPCDWERTGTGLNLTFKCKNCGDSYRVGTNSGKGLSYSPGCMAVQGPAPAPKSAASQATDPCNFKPDGSGFWTCDDCQFNIGPTNYANLVLNPVMWPACSAKAAQAPAPTAPAQSTLPKYLSAPPPGTHKAHRWDPSSTYCQDCSCAYLSNAGTVSCPGVLVSGSAHALSAATAAQHRALNSMMPVPHAASPTVAPVLAGGKLTFGGSWKVKQVTTLPGGGTLTAKYFSEDDEDSPPPAPKAYPTCSSCDIELCFLDTTYDEDLEGLCSKCQKNHVPPGRDPFDVW